MGNKKNHTILAIRLSIITLTISLLLQCNNNSNTDVFLKYRNKMKINGYIVYKNAHRDRRLYIEDIMNDNGNTVLSEFTYNRPPDNDYKDVISSAMNDLYEKSSIGDSIYKIPNSNKCILYKKDSIFRYNCYNLTLEEKTSLNAKEWNPNEIGFWKLDSQGDSNSYP